MKVFGGFKFRFSLLRFEVEFNEAFVDDVPLRFPCVVRVVPAAPFYEKVPFAFDFLVV